MTGGIAPDVAAGGVDRDLLPLPDGRTVVVEGTGSRRRLSDDGGPPVVLRIDGEGVCLTLDLPGGSDDTLLAALHWAFARHPDCARVVLPDLDASPEAVRRGLLVRDGGGSAWISHRAMFWQQAASCLPAGATGGYPLMFTMTDGKRHPIRPRKPVGIVYRRFDARLGAWISLRTLDIATDLECFNRWQNTPRVAAFWQEGGSLEQHRAYLERLESDPHTLTLIGCFDDQPFGYFEAYWAKEDRIAPFSSVGDHDRGVHMLVGEAAHRGPHKVASWLPALVHYLFLDDPRTQTIVAEPRADNAVMIGYLQSHGFNRERDFDFPHKRAALMALSRERFFAAARLF